MINELNEKSNEVGIGIACFFVCLFVVISETVIMHIQVLKLHCHYNNHKANTNKAKGGKWLIMTSNKFKTVMGHGE